MQLISDELNAALVNQLCHEKFNSSLYLFIAGYLKNKGLEHLAEKFEQQHEEEFKHSLMIYDILTDLSSPVELLEIPEVNKKFETIIDVATAYLEREIETTNSLDAIKKLAIDEDNCVVEESMRDMIKIQRNEYQESTTFLDMANLTGGDWKTVLLWDLSLK